MLRYIELKTNQDDCGPAWIACVQESRSGRTVYFNGKCLKRAIGIYANYYDPQSGAEYWISGVKKRGTNRHWAGSGKIMVEAAAADELKSWLNVKRLDPSVFTIIDRIRPTSPADFVQRENTADGLKSTFKRNSPSPSEDMATLRTGF